MAEANTLAYYDLATVTTVKCFYTGSCSKLDRTIFVSNFYGNTRLGWKGLPGTLFDLRQPQSAT